MLSVGSEICADHFDVIIGSPQRRRLPKFAVPSIFRLSGCAAVPSKSYEKAKKRKLDNSRRREKRLRQKIATLVKEKGILAAELRKLKADWQSLKGRYQFI
jgi:hypothetical protein